jgi:DNA-binding PadR family transcriptional regulator
MNFVAYRGRVGLEHALLVALTERSGSGYELARRFDKSIGHFWSATHQQIYRVLKRMAEQGWVNGELVGQDGRPDKTVYTVSDAGRAELTRWIAEPTQPEPLRGELGVKVRGATAADLPALLAEVARHRAEHQRRLKLYRQIEKKDFGGAGGCPPDQHSESPPGPLSGRTLHQYLVLRGGIRAEEALIGWCDEILTALETT